MKIDPPGSLGSILQVPGAETGIKHRLVDFFAHLFDLLSGVFLEALAFFLMVFFPGSFFLGGGRGGGICALGAFLEVFGPRDLENRVPGAILPSLEVGELRRDHS